MADPRNFSKEKRSNFPGYKADVSAQANAEREVQYLVQYGGAVWAAIQKRLASAVKDGRGDDDYYLLLAKSAWFLRDFMGDYNANLQEAIAEERIK
jgi:hypothetical protein